MILPKRLDPNSLPVAAANLHHPNHDQPTQAILTKEQILPVVVVVVVALVHWAVC